MKALMDCHSHTKFSPDGESSAEEMCEKACELGLEAYAITDHCECSTWHEKKFYEDRGDRISLDPFVVYDYAGRFERYVSKITELKEKYSQKLNFICGIELGQIMQGIDGAEYVAKCKKLDFIIGSLHQNRGCDDYAFLDFEKFSDKEISVLVRDYYDELYEMCRHGDFDVLGHLTYPLRYICGDFGRKVDMSEYDEVIREIFKSLIENDRGIEINTSGLRQKYGKPFPTLEYVKLFHDMGGKYLSVGSDSHKTADLGKGITDGMKIARNAGFEKLTYFKNREPHFLEF